MHELISTIKLSFRNLYINMGRSTLTLIGVVIGITSVIVISSSGQGVRTYVLSLIASFGTDVIQVETKIPSTNKTNVQQPSSVGTQITTLKNEDAEAVAKLPNVEDVYTGNIAQELAVYQNINKRIFILGAGAHAPNVDPGLKVVEGNFFTESDDKGLAQVAVLGPEVKDSLFGNDNAVGKIIKIKGQNYKVIGVLDKRGSMGIFSYDSLVYIPQKTVQKKLLGIDFLTYFTVKVKDNNIADTTVSDIQNLLRKRHKIDDPEKDDFIATSMKEALDMIKTIFQTIDILLLALISISLVVGGVGIMNVMYVSVVERTFEIGLRKAVGAKSSTILKQFLLEAIIITFTGGVIGIILGYIFSLLFSIIFKYLGYELQFIITLNSILLAVGFSVATGIIFGFYPAYAASKLSPMEAINKS